MDSSKFEERFPGRLVEMRRPDAPKKMDCAFIPDLLPMKWECPVHVWRLIGDAKLALGELNGIAHNLDSPEPLLHPLQARESIASSNIEGTYVTPQQLSLFKLDPKEPKSARDEAADQREVLNYSECLRVGHELLQSTPASHKVIRDMHSVLMSGKFGLASAGGYRTVHVQIGHDGRFIPPPPNEIQGLMDNLVSYIRDPSDDHDPLVRAYIAHYQFETIHPFEDGNGRIGRALVALLISEWLEHSQPWLYMSAYFEKYKEDYISKLFRVSTHGDITGWIEFCLAGTIHQAKDAVRRCRGFIALRKRYTDIAESRGPTSRTATIISELFCTPVLTVPYVRNRFNIGYATAKRDIDFLIKCGILEEHQNSFPKSFFAPDIYDIAFASEYIEADEEDEATSDPTGPELPF